jgi:hypothetical protein
MGRALFARKVEIVRTDIVICDERNSGCIEGAFESRAPGKKTKFVPDR